MNKEEEIDLIQHFLKLYTKITLDKLQKEKTIDLLLIHRGQKLESN